MPNDEDRPAIPNEENRPEMPNKEFMPNNQPEMQTNTNTIASNKEFIIDGISNLFSGVSNYTE